MGFALMRKFYFIYNYDNDRNIFNGPCRQFTKMYIHIALSGDFQALLRCIT
jgi:hypothetical protein